MKLILIRHGETEESKNGILLGQLPGTLSRNGKREMATVAKQIREMNQNPEIIFSSDLRRAKDSAKIIARILKLKIRYSKLLRERKGGEAEGKRENEINWKQYENGPRIRRKHAGGESFSEVKRRAKEFLCIPDLKEHKTIILVSHHAFLAMLISYTKKMGAEKALKIKFSNSMVVLNISKENRVGHTHSIKSPAIARS